MSDILQANFDDVELTPIFSIARKRWRLAYATLYSTRALLSLVKQQGECLDKLLRSPSYTAINVKPDHFFYISQSSLTKLVESKNIEQVLQFGGVEGVVSALETDSEKGIQGSVEDISNRRKVFGLNTYKKTHTNA